MCTNKPSSLLAMVDATVLSLTRANEQATGTTGTRGHTCPGTGGGEVFLDSVQDGKGAFEVRLSGNLGSGDKMSKAR